METFDKKAFAAFINTAAAIMDEKRDYLIELDANLGDGDLGLTMAKGFQKAKEFVETETDDALGKYIMKTGMVFAKEVPSTMGTLVASGFMKAGKGITGDVLDAGGVATLVVDFCTGVMERGKAKVGECTIVDALYPAGQAALEAAAVGKDIPAVAAAALCGAKQGLEATKDMEPKYGKAAVFASKAMGVADQGAVVGMLINQALATAVSA